MRFSAPKNLCLCLVVAFAPKRNTFLRILNSQAIAVFFNWMAFGHFGISVLLHRSSIPLLLLYNMNVWMSIANNCMPHMKMKQMKNMFSYRYDFQDTRLNGRESIELIKIEVRITVANWTAKARLSIDYRKIIEKMKCHWPVYQDLFVFDISPFSAFEMKTHFILQLINMQQYKWFRFASALHPYPFSVQSS